MVLVSAVTCLAVLHNLGSVGIGTIIAAVLAGTVVGIITKAFGKQRDKILGKTDEDLRCKGAVALKRQSFLQKRIRAGLRKARLLV